MIYEDLGSCQTLSWPEEEISCSRSCKLQEESGCGNYSLSVGVIILPNSVVRPATRRCTGGTTISSEHQWVGVDESVRVASAGRPPRGVGVEKGINTRLSVVGVAEVLDPGYSGAGREYATTLKIEHTGECDAIAGPPTAVSKEVVRLSGAGAGVLITHLVPIYHTTLGNNILHNAFSRKWAKTY